MAGKQHYTIDAVANALCVLEAFLEEGRGEQSVKEISEHLGLNKSRVFRILSTLEGQGFVRRHPQTKRYRLGLKLFELGQQVARQFDLMRAAEPVVAELTERTEETSYVYWLNGMEAVTVVKREPKQSMRISAELGHRDPLTVGAACSLLLAHLPKQTIDRVLTAGPLPKLTPKTVTDVDAIKKKLAQIRRQGFHLTRGEEQEGVDAVAAPIRDSSGQVVAAVAVAGPSLRFTREKSDLFISLVCEAGRRISTEIGYIPTGRPQ